YERYLLDQGWLTKAKADKLKEKIKGEIDEALDIAFSEPQVDSVPERELDDVYAPAPAQLPVAAEASDRQLRFVDAISEGMAQAMAKHEKLILMGQDIAEYGGVFKITEGLVDKFGQERVRNTPLCESAIIGIALGLSFKSYKSMVEMQFGDFVSCGFNQIVNNLAKIHYRWQHAADVVIRMPCGAGVGAGPFHSQTNEAWFAHTPGLKVVYPSTPEDAKGLLLASFADPNPVLFFEHKALYRSITGNVPTDYYATPIGKARLVRAGSGVTVLTYGAGVYWAGEIVEEIGADAEILDLRTLLPLDYEAIETSLRKTNKVIVLHEDTLFGGIGGELSAHISEHMFEHLDAPVVRVGSLDTPVPFANSLEEQFLPRKRFREKLEWIISY
ncbi:MAG: transketolase C-terminal domain-containing protein, partial [Saprospiraceae bacterium]|nr:transketolase C-terminal domain-containing protein [Saprospiraceae bacterium]